jgi:[acyl-carrier-protein] S-malonyltransferase
LPRPWPGHSLGEYSALVAAGVLTLAQAAPLVRLRAQAMQEAVPVGTGRHGRHSGPGCCKSDSWLRRGDGSHGAAGTEVVEAVNFNDPARP